MNSFYCSRPVKSSGELKSRGVKLLPGKDNTNKLSLSKSFYFSYATVFIVIFILFCLVDVELRSGSMFLSCLFFCCIIWLKN